MEAKRATETDPNYPYNHLALAGGDHAAIER